MAPRSTFSALLQAHANASVCADSVRRHQARHFCEAGELAERAGDLHDPDRPRENARGEQNRQGSSRRARTLAREGRSCEPPDVCFCFQDDREVDRNEGLKFARKHSMLFIGTYSRIRHAHLESRSHQMERGAATTFPSDVSALIVELEAAEASLGAPGARSGFVALFMLTLFGFGSGDGRRSCVVIKIWRRSVSPDPCPHVFPIHICASGKLG